MLQYPGKASKLRGMTSDMADFDFICAKCSKGMPSLYLLRKHEWAVHGAEDPGPEYIYELSNKIDDLAEDIDILIRQHSHD